MKPCRKCKTYKPLTEFYKNTASPDNKTSLCKACNREDQIKRTPKKPGWIYIMSNPAWPGYFKVGKSSMGIDKRLLSYQTGSPLRDYKMIFSKYVNDTYNVERLVSEKFNGCYEWYNEKLPNLISFIESI